MTAAPIPLTQYWDTGAPPPEVAPLMAAWAADGAFDYRAFDRGSADAFVAAHFDAATLAAFRLCAVPAMQADVFRLCAVLVRGGVYVDADTDNAGTLPAMLAAHAGPRGALMTRNDVVANDFLYLRAPGDPLLARALAAAVRNVARRSGDNVWAVTGPGVLTALYADPATRPLFEGLPILPVTEVRRHVLFRWDLAYKDEASDWRLARSIFEDEPMTPTPPLERATPDELNALFARVSEADRERFPVPEATRRWLFAERLAARNERREMSFEAYEGPEHLAKFYTWHRRADLMDVLGTAIDDLAEASLAADRRAFAAHGIAPDEALLRKIARYNAQDYVYQRPVPVPERQYPRVILDFGAGHGRMANLAFNTPRPGERARTYVAVEAIPSTYFTQNAYFRGLGLSVWDYLDHHDEAVGPETIAAAMAAHEVVHLPTWLLPLVPAGSVDMVTCVQVLKELPGDLVPWLAREFGRIVGPSGSLYIRDHLQFHNPNHMPIDLLVGAAGFSLEYAPLLRDRAEIHGLPRLWRKVDGALFV